MSVFLNFLLPSAFEEFNVNTQMNQSQSAFIKRVCQETDLWVFYSVETWLLEVTEAVVNAESRLEFRNIKYHLISRVGFGSFKSPSIPCRNSHKYRRVIYVHEADENAYQAKSVQVHLQAYWTKLSDFVKNDLSW